MVGVLLVNSHLRNGLSEDRGGVGVKKFLKTYLSSIECVDPLFLLAA